MLYTQNDPQLKIQTPHGLRILDLRQILRARLWDLIESREILVTDFEPRLWQPLADGLRVQLVNLKHGLFIPVELREDREGFRLRIKTGWICEQMSINRRLMAIDVLPDWLRTQTGDPGFYMLPSFSGTLVKLGGHDPMVTEDRMYMHQSAWEKLGLMNCFALQQQGKGVLAIAHQGDFFCHVVTELNQSDQNRVYARFGVRHKPAEPVKQQDKELLIRYVTDPRDSYVALAKAYRRYLTEERGVSLLKHRIENNPVLAYSVSAMRTKIFHGMKPSSLDGTVDMKVRTTFAQAEAILDHMWDSGIKRAVVTLVGWNLGGHDGAYPQRFPVEPTLGGEVGLRKLIAKAKSMGYQIVPHDNMTDMYRIARTYNPDAVLRDEDQNPVLGGLWGGGQAVKSCPLAYFDHYGPDVTRVRELGFEGHFYCDAQSNPLYCCHDPRHPADEEQFAISQCKLAQSYRGIYGAVAQEMGPAYALPFVDEINVHSPYKLDFCLRRLDENYRRMIDRVVPFYQLAIHGLVTYQESWVHAYRRDGLEKGLLRALGYGVRPSMEVVHGGRGIGDIYTDSIRDVIETYHRAFEQLSHTHALLVEDFEELDDQASRITYEDGTITTVNWSDSKCGDLKPMSICIEDAHATVSASNSVVTL